MTADDQEKMGTALNRLAIEDPTFKVSYNHETGQTIIGGMGELYLEIVVDRLKREFGVGVKTGAPQVAYRETISANADSPAVMVNTVIAKSKSNLKIAAKVMNLSTLSKAVLFPLTLFLLLKRVSKKLFKKVLLPATPAPISKSLFMTALTTKLTLPKWLSS